MVFLYSVLLGLICFIEQSRIALLLSSLFPGSDPSLVSLAITILALFTLVILDGGSRFQSVIVSGSFFLLLSLSYAHGISTEVKRLKNDKNSKISILTEKKSQLLAEMTVSQPKNCYFPDQNSEFYDAQLARYKACLASQEAFTASEQVRIASIKASIEDIREEIKTMKSSPIDYSDLWIMGLTGFFMSLFVTISASRLSSLFAGSIKSFKFRIRISEDEKIAILVSKGESVRGVAKKIGLSPTTVHRRLKRYKTETVQEQSGTKVEHLRNTTGTGVKQTGTGGKILKIATQSGY